MNIGLPNQALQRTGLSRSVVRDQVFKCSRHGFCGPVAELVRPHDTSRHILSSPEPYIRFRRVALLLGGIRARLQFRRTCAPARARVRAAVTYSLHCLICCMRRRTCQSRPRREARVFTEPLLVGFCHRARSLCWSRVARHHLGQLLFTMTRTRPNKPDAVNSAIATRFHGGCPWRGVADTERSAK